MRKLYEQCLSQTQFSVLNFEQIFQLSQKRLKREIEAGPVSKRIWARCNSRRIFANRGYAPPPVGCASGHRSLYPPPEIFRLLPLPHLFPSRLGVSPWLPFLCFCVFLRPFLSFPVLFLLFFVRVGKVRAFFQSFFSLVIFYGFFYKEIIYVSA